MAAAFQQQIFALDARFNAYRAPGNPNFSTFYTFFIFYFEKSQFARISLFYAKNIIYSS